MDPNAETTQPPEKPSSRNAAGVYEPFPAAVVPWESFERGRFGMRYQHLSSYGGGTQIGVALEVLEPGHQANQAHYHMLEEEHVYLIEGTLTVRLGEARYRMQPGDYVCFPAGQKVAHALMNETDSPCRYLIFGASHDHDVMVFPDLDRVRVRLTGATYALAPTFGYWDDVDTAPLPRTDE